MLTYLFYFCLCAVVVLGIDLINYMSSMNVPKGTAIYDFLKCLLIAAMLTILHFVLIKPL